MSPTNFDLWRNYTDGLISPDSYINWGYWYLISAALQRRVWIGPSHSPLFANQFTILVGEPGVGKGLVIKQVANILQHHKIKNPREINVVKDEIVDKEFAKAVAESEYDKAYGQLNTTKQKEKGEIEKPLLFPVAADATTFEALVHSLANSIRRINYEHFDEKSQRKIMSPYAHSSLCFCLEEMSSLFRKKAEAVVNLCIKAYDCGDYIYDTKTSGKDRVKNCCL